MRRWQWHEVYWSGQKLRCTTWTDGVPWPWKLRGTYGKRYEKMVEDVGQYGERWLNMWDMMGK